MSESEWSLTDSAASLALGSTTVYKRGHIRVVEAGTVRLQGCWMGHNWEAVQSLSQKLCEYIETLDHPNPSTAGSGTMYARCLFRRQDNAATSVRVQIPGPEFNRPWGVEFVLPVAPNIHARLPMTEASEPAPMPAPSLAKAGFTVGDKVVIVKEGDGNGCGGGPLVGTTGVVGIVGEDGACGPIVFEYVVDGHKVTWNLPAAHIAPVVVVEDAEPAPYPTPASAENDAF